MACSSIAVGGVDIVSVSARGERPTDKVLDTHTVRSETQPSPQVEATPLAPIASSFWKRRRATGSDMAGTATTWRCRPNPWMDVERSSHDSAHTSSWDRCFRSPPCPRQVALARRRQEAEQCEQQAWRSFDKCSEDGVEPVRGDNPIRSSCPNKASLPRWDARVYTNTPLILRPLRVIHRGEADEVEGRDVRARRTTGRPRALGCMRQAEALS